MTKKKSSGPVPLRAKNGRVRTDACAKQAMQQDKALFRRTRAMMSQIDAHVATQGPGVAREALRLLQRKLREAARAGQMPDRTAAEVKQLSDEELVRDVLPLLVNVMRYGHEVVRRALIRHKKRS